MTLYVGLHDRSGSGESVAVASASVPVPPSPEWQVVNFPLLVPSANMTCVGSTEGADPTISCGAFGENPGHACIKCGGEFVIGLAAPGSAHIGYVYAAPGPWGRLGDLPVLKLTTDAMVAMGVSVIRQGGTVSRTFRWKDWRGSPWLRPSMGHVWHSALVGSWGLFEFLDMTAAMNVKPIVTLAHDLNTAADWGDLVEYLFGDDSTAWGRVRVVNDSHPTPYIIDTFELGK